MYVIAVDLTIYEQHLIAFMPLLLENARSSRETESACRRFDVCCDPLRPQHIFLYELYDNRAAFDAHVASAHFKAFDGAVNGMVATKVVHAYELASG